MDARTIIGEITRSDLSGHGDDALLTDVENWDSLRAVRLVLRLEEILGRPLTEQDIDALKSVGDVARMLRPAA